MVSVWCGDVAIARSLRIKVRKCGYNMARALGRGNSPTNHVQSQECCKTLLMSSLAAFHPRSISLAADWSPDTAATIKRIETGQTRLICMNQSPSLQPTMLKREDMGTSPENGSYWVVVVVVMECEVAKSMLLNNLPAVEVVIVEVNVLGISHRVDKVKEEVVELVAL